MIRVLETASCADLHNLPSFLFSCYKPVPKCQLSVDFRSRHARLGRQIQDKVANFLSVQIKFFKLRQAEFEPYKFLVDPLQVPIGNLASPLYFDFIAFSQYATLSKAIPDAPQVFQVCCNAITKLSTQHHITAAHATLNKPRVTYDGIKIRLNGMRRCTVLESSTLKISADFFPG